MLLADEPELLLLRRRVAELEGEQLVWVEAAGKLLDSVTGADVIETILEIGPRFVAADACGVWRKGWAGAAELPRDPMLFEDIEQAPLLAARRPELRGEGIRSVLAIPLRLRDEDYGAVLFYWRAPHPFTATEMRSAKAFGKLAAAALATGEVIERANAELDVVTDRVPELVSYIDPQERYARVNRAYEEMFGMKPEQIVGKTVAEIVGRDSYEVAKPHLERALRGEPQKFESRARRHDGAVRKIKLSYTHDIASDGAIRGIVVMVQDTTEQDIAHEARARLAAIVDSSDDAIISKTLDGVVVSWNVGAERIFGYTDSEAIGRHITLIIPEERWAEEEYVLGRVRRGERVDHFETERRTKDGRTIHISLTVSPVRDAGGTIIGASKTARNITDKKQSEARLLASEHYLQAVLTAMPECVMVLGPLGAVLRMNDSGLAMLDADVLEQMIGHCVYPMVGETDREAFRSLIGGIFRGEAGGTLEFEVTGLKGMRRTFEANVVPLPGGQSIPTGALCVTRDVSGRRLVEAERIALLERERKARKTAELLNRVGPIVSAELDPQRLAQKITDLATEAVRAEFGALFRNVKNEQGKSYMLYTLSGVPRETFERFPMPGNPEVFGTTFCGEGPVRSDDITGDPRYGNNAPYFGMPEGHLPVRSYLAVPLVSRTGAVIGGIFFGHSSTGMFTADEEQIALGIGAQAAIALDNASLFAESQRSQAAVCRFNEDLQRANEDLNQFAYSASHDLQEPLRTVSVYSQLLRRKIKSTLDDEGEEYLSRILRGARRMEALIRAILDYSQASIISENPAPVTDANAALEIALSNLKATIEDSGTSVIRGELPRVRILEFHLSQIFQNVIGNAIKYRREEAPRIVIRAEQRQRECLFSIEDNGIGIEARYKEQIFGIFKRLHSADEYSGTGIGLAICQRLVERSGGRIWVESQPGRGSTFFFTLPFGE